MKSTTGDSHTKGTERKNISIVRRWRGDTCPRTPHSFQLYILSSRLKKKLASSQNPQCKHQTPFSHIPFHDHTFADIYIYIYLFFRICHKPNKCLPNHWRPYMRSPTQAHMHPHTHAVSHKSVGNWANEFSLCCLRAPSRLCALQSAYTVLSSVRKHARLSLHIVTTKPTRTRTYGKRKRSYYDCPSWSLFWAKYIYVYIEWMRNEPIEWWWWEILIGNETSIAKNKLTELRRVCVEWVKGGKGEWLAGNVVVKRKRSIGNGVGLTANGEDINGAIDSDCNIFLFYFKTVY